MGTRYLWNGSGSDLGAAADWTNAATGTASTTVPTYSDTATITAPGLIIAAGTVSVGLTTIDTDVVLDGRLITGGISLSGGTLEMGATGQLVIRSTALHNGVASLGTGGAIGGTGRVDGTFSLTAGATLLANGGALAVFGTVTGVGTLGVAAGATLFDVGAVSAGITAAFLGRTGTLELYGATASQFGATISGFAGADAIDIAGASYLGAAWNAGTLTLTGAGATLSLLVPGSLAGAGFVALPDGLGGTLIELAPPATTLTSTSGTLALGRAGTLTVAAGSGSGGVVTVTNTVALAGSLQAGRMTQSGLLTVQGGASLSAGALTASGVVMGLAGASLSAAAVTLTGGTLAIDPAALAGIGGSGGTAGTLAVAAGATAAGHGQITAPLECDGLVMAAGGALGLFGNVTGAGTLAVGSFATLFLADAVAPGPMLAFTGTGGELSLFSPRACAGTIEGFQPGDLIDAAVALDAVSVGGKALTLAAQGIDLARIPILGDFSAAQFILQADGSGGTLIGVVNCFVAGTRIATPQGPQPVERLRPGDAVLTPDGPRCLCWTGRQTVNARQAPELRPVVFAPGALGGGVPLRALRLSPEHGLRIGDALVPAVALVNGTTIRRPAAGIVAYHHLAVEPHGLVFAEGWPAETFLAEAVGAFDWQAGRLPMPGDPCLPRLEEGAALEAIRAMLGAPPHPHRSTSGPLLGHVERAVVARSGWHYEGWASDAGNDSTPLALALTAGAARIGTVIANRWRADLERAGLGDGRHGFTVTCQVPPERLAIRRATDGVALAQAVVSA